MLGGIDWETSIISYSPIAEFLIMSCIVRDGINLNETIAYKLAILTNRIEAVLFHHDNARTHKSLVARQKLQVFDPLSIRVTRKSKLL